MLQLAGEAEADERPPNRPNRRGMERLPLEREGVPRGIDSGSDCTLGASGFNGAGAPGCSAVQIANLRGESLVAFNST